MKRIYSHIFKVTKTIEDPSVRSLVSRTAAGCTWAIGGSIAIANFGFDISPLLATLGVGGATLGFACRDVGANVVAGVALAVQRPFVTGTKMCVGGPGASIRGTVHHWDLRYLYLRGPSGEVLFVPNSIVFSNVITVENPPSDFFRREGRDVGLPVGTKPPPPAHILNPGSSNAEKAAAAATAAAKAESQAAGKDAASPAASSTPAKKMKSTADSEEDDEEEETKKALEKKRREEETDDEIKQKKQQLEKEEEEQLRKQKEKRAILGNLLKPAEENPKKRDKRKEEEKENEESKIKTTQNSDL